MSTNRKDIQRPAFMQRAMQGKSGHIAIVEILLAMVVFAVSFVAMGIIQFPLMFMELMSNTKYMDLILQGDQQSMQAAMDIAMNIPEWLMIIILLSEILMILVVILYCRFVEKRGLDTMGFRKKGAVSQYILGMLGGFFFFSIAYLLCVLTGSIHFDGMTGHIAPLYIAGYLLGYMIQGMAEEVLCRGYLFVSLTRRHSLKYSILLSSVFFAALHGMNPGLSLLAVLNLILFGIFAALVLVKCENIWIVGAFHSIWNFVQGNLYGIQVSGNSLQQSIFGSTCNKGYTFMNGGSFGMEGGLAVTLVLGVGVAALLWSLKRDGKIVEMKIPMSVSVMGGLSYGMPQEDVLPEEKLSEAFSGSSGKPQTVVTPSEDIRKMGMPLEENLPKIQLKRENMGVTPGETPWRPDQNAQEETAKQQQNLFNADYFKD